MGDKKSKSDKPTKKTAPPIVSDPKLERKIECGEKPPEKPVTIKFEIRGK